MVGKQLAFLKEYPRGIYRVHFLATLEDERLSVEDEKIFRRNLEYLTKHQKEGFIQTPDEFFQRWLNGHCGKKPDLQQYFDCKGFELQEPRIKIERFDDGRIFGQIRGLVIASDFGYGDFRDRTVFAINDTPSQRVLTYHDNGEIMENPLGRKNLTHEPIYPFGGKPDRYPFNSLNPLKSCDYTWALVNIAPKEAYEAIRKIGFVW